MVFFLCFFCPFPWSASKGVRSLTRAWNILGPSASFLLFLTCVSAWAHWTRKVGNEQGFSTKTEQSFVNTWCQSLSLLSPGKCKTFILFHNDLMRSEFQITPRALLLEMLIMDFHNRAVWAGRWCPDSLPNHLTFEGVIISKVGFSHRLTKP